MADPRINPFVELEPEQVRAMLSPVLNGGAIEGIERIEEGLSHTILRITADRGEEIYGVRVYSGERDRFDREVGILRRFAAAIPVPEIIFVDVSGQHCSNPYMVYRWIPGITLNECRKQVSPETLLTLAKPLGQLLGRLARQAPPEGRAIRFEPRETRLQEWLSGGRARERLGPEVADRLATCFVKYSSRLRECDQEVVFVHGDFAPRNILVDRGESGKWNVAGVLDWEFANAGSRLWDVGHLFRYSNRYSPAFRDAFAEGYSETASALTSDWWLISRLLDAARLVKILDLPQELPETFADCTDQLSTLVSDLRVRA